MDSDCRKFICNSTVSSFFNYSAVMNWTMNANRPDPLPPIWPQYGPHLSRCTRLTTLGHSSQIPGRCIPVAFPTRPQRKGRFPCPLASCQPKKAQRQPGTGLNDNQNGRRAGVGGCQAGFTSARPKGVSCSSWSISLLSIYLRQTCICCCIFKITSIASSECN